MVNVFDYNDYKRFISAVELERTPYVRGFRSRLSESLNCQNAYVSHVLNTHANFSLEQAFNITQFLELNESETRYFILLVELARAGTKELKSHFKSEIEKIREKHLNIRERVPKAEELSFENQSIYYSSWFYPTIHIMVTIPTYRDPVKIKNALGVPSEVVKDVIFFLVSTGLITEKGGQLYPGATQIHLGKDSPFILHHHSNWRAVAVQDLHKKPGKGIHYSTVSSLSYDDAEKLKSKFVKMIQEYVEAVGPSKEETIYNFNFDFYDLL